MSTQTATKMPGWAQRLLDKHPGAEAATAENPMPGWLEAELKKVPLWYHIREASSEPRFKPPHHLIEDVGREPELLRGVLKLQPRFDELAKKYKSEGIEHIVLIGCGSAFYNSVLGPALYPKTTGLSAEAMEAWEFYNYYVPTGRKTLMIAQSATGGSYEVLYAVQKAKEMGISTLALTNTKESALEDLADETVAFPTGQKTGPDVGVIPTRLMMMYMLAAALGGDRAKTVATQMKQIPDIAERFINEQKANVEAAAKKYHKQECIFVVGSGPNWFTALEAGLKMEEESTTPCRAYTSADYHHMAISLLAPNRTTMIFAPEGPSYERLATCARTSKAGGSPVITVVQEGDTVISKDADDVFTIPGNVDELLLPPLGTIVGQFYGYFLGLEKGFNPDCLGTDDLGHAKAWLTSFPLGTH